MKRHLILITVLLLSALPSYSALVLTLAPPDFIGNALVFGGTLSNTGPGDLFLNDLAISIAPPGDTYLTKDPNFFFANVPGLLLSGESYTGPIFRLLIAPNSPPATYTAVVSILGGADEIALDALQESPLSVSVAIPEPASMALVASALVALAAARRRFTYRRSPQ